jgi:hypothetical protein
MAAVLERIAHPMTERPELVPLLRRLLLIVGWEVEMANDDGLEVAENV